MGNAKNLINAAAFNRINTVCYTTLVCVSCSVVGENPTKLKYCIKPQTQYQQSNSVCNEHISGFLKIQLLK